MLIKILGTRGEIEIRKPLHDNHSGILVDKTILCDVGEKNNSGIIKKMML